MSDNHSELTLFDYTCPDTGKVLRLRKVPFTATDSFYKQYERDHPRPLPPMYLVDYGEGEKITEPNVSHPLYISRLERWTIERNIWVNDQVRHFFSQMAIECEFDPSEVLKLREAVRKNGGGELDPDDKYVYVWEICVGTLEGHNDLILAIQRRSRPMEDQIAAAKESFRSKV